jgi:hypothetical protein
LYNGKTSLESELAVAGHSELQNIRVTDEASVEGIKGIISAELRVAEDYAFSNVIVAGTLNTFNSVEMLAVVWGSNILYQHDVQ